MVSEIQANTDISWEKHTWLDSSGNAVTCALGLVGDLLDGGLLAIRLEGGCGLVGVILAAIEESAFASDTASRAFSLRDVLRRTERQT